MPTSNAERQRTHQERQKAKLAALDSLYTAVHDAAERGHELSTTILDDDPATIISHLAKWFDQETTTPHAPKPVVVAQVRQASIGSYECCGLASKKAFLPWPPISRCCSTQGITAAIPAQFWGQCPQRLGFPGIPLHLTTTAGATSLEVVWEQHGKSTVT